MGDQFDFPVQLLDIRGLTFLVITLFYVSLIFKHPQNGAHKVYTVSHIVAFRSKNACYRLLTM